MSVFAVVGEGELDGTGESEQVRSYSASEISVSFNLGLSLVIP